MGLGFRLCGLSNLVLGAVMENQIENIAGNDMELGVGVYKGCLWIMCVGAFHSNRFRGKLVVVTTVCSQSPVVHPTNLL